MKNSIEISMLSGKFNREPAPIPKSLSSKFKIEVNRMDRRKIWQITPKEEAPNRVILFLHGGAYIHNITGLHWQFISKLLAKTLCTVVVPDYPLTPFANCRDVYPFIQTIYNRLLNEYQPDDIILMGDSAGGGLALGFAQLLRNENQPLPGQVILLSPWLDVTMSNPQIYDVDQKDKILGIAGLKLAGKAYAGGENPKKYKISPLYGEMDGLPMISLFTGTHDLLFFDSQALKHQLDAAHQPLNYFEYPKMIHDWILITPMKESKVAIEQIVGVINYS